MLSENLPLPPTLYDSLKMTTKMIIPRHDYELLQQTLYDKPPFYAIANQYYRFIMFILYAIMKEKIRSTIKLKNKNY